MCKPIPTVTVVTGVLAVAVSWTLALYIVWSKYGALSLMSVSVIVTSANVVRRSAVSVSAASTYDVTQMEACVSIHVHVRTCTCTSSRDVSCYLNKAAKQSNKTHF